MSKLTERLDELRAISADEGISIKDASERALTQFADVFGEPLAVFLLDNGNLRGRWHSDTWSTAIEFDGLNLRTIHLRRAALEVSP